MPRTLSTLAALLVGVAALVAGQGLLNTTVSLQLEARGVHGLLLSAVLAAYFAGWIAGCVGAPRLLRSVGHVRTFAALAGATCATTLLYALAPSPFVWLLLRGVSGFAMAGLLLTVENWLTLQAEPGRRGAVLSLYLVVFHLGFGGGQFLLMLTGTGDHVPFLVAAVLLSVAAIPVATTRTVVPSLPAGAWLQARRPLLTAQTALIAALASGVINAAYQTLAPIYLQRVGFDVQDAGLWMGLAVLAGLALQWPIGFLSDRWDRRVLILGVCLGLAGTSALFALGGFGLAGLLVLGCLFGSLVALVYPLALAHANDRVAAEDSLGLGAMMVMVAGIGALIGPFLAGISMDLLGPAGLFWFTGGTAALLALFSAWRVLVRAAPKPADVEPYVPAMDTTAAALQLDPRIPRDEVELLVAADELQGDVAPGDATNVP